VSLLCGECKDAPLPYSTGWKETARIKNFDPLSNRSQDVTIVQLCATDGDNTHIIAIAGDWLFDSNRHSAMPLSRENLDRCCLGAEKFLRSSYAVRLVPGKKLRRIQENGPTAEDGPTAKKPKLA
jgi:hypothetical protein